MYTRRDFAKIAAVSLPLSTLALAQNKKINSTIAE